jgi:hypothetical protein
MSDRSPEGIVLAIGRRRIVDGNNPANLSRLGNPVENPSVAGGENSERDGVINSLALPLPEC